jgi:hypothetical protein
MTTLWSTRSSSSIAGVQILIPEANPPLSPLSEVVLSSRVPSSPPHGRRRPLGELRRRPVELGFWPCVPAAGGRRRPGAVDPDLIGRLRALHTASAPAAPGGRAPPIRWFKSPLPRTPGRSGPTTQRIIPGLLRSSPLCGFFRDIH